MHSLLTYYDEKLHLKTVWNEGFEAGQEEIAELKNSNDKLKNDNNTLRATIQDKDVALADKDAEIEELKRQLAEAKK